MPLNYCLVPVLTWYYIRLWEHRTESCLSSLFSSDILFYNKHIISYVTNVFLLFSAFFKLIKYLNWHFHNNQISFLARIILFNFPYKTFLIHLASPPICTSIFLCNADVTPATISKTCQSLSAPKSYFEFCLHIYLSIYFSLSIWSTNQNDKYWPLSDSN